VRFGNDHEKTKAPQKTEGTTENAPAEPVKDSVEIGNEPEAQKPAPKPAPQNLSIFDRIGKFFEYLKKAFKVLFGGNTHAPGEPPKSEPELQIKGLKLAAVGDGLSELPEEKAELLKHLDGLSETTQKNLKTNDLLKHLRIKHELIAASDRKDQYKLFLKETATPETRRQFIKDQLEQPHPKVLERFNLLRQAAGQEALSGDEFKDALLEHPEEAPALYKFASVIPESKVLSTPQRIKQAFSPTAIKTVLFAKTPDKNEEAPEAEDA